ncbi:MAG: hypothetical protein R3C26_23455 [Calditrichia bacterium]
MPKPILNAQWQFATHGDRIGNARTLMEIARLQDTEKWLEAVYIRRASRGKLPS